MFDSNEIARRALQRASEIKAGKKTARRRAAIISGVCVAGLGVFFLVRLSRARI